MSSDINQFCEFSSFIAKKYGIDIAIIHGFFKKHEYLSTMQDEMNPYPSVAQCCQVLNFWDEDKIRQLISELYLHKLV